MAITSRRIRINLALVSLSFLLNMSAYMCLEGLQSSLNAEAGTISLTAVYSSIILSSLFLPTLAIDFLNARRAVGVAPLCYVAYTLANCYPRPYILIPAAVIMGAGGAIYWSAGRVFISDLATTYAEINGVAIDRTMSSFYGTFMGVVCCAFFIGNVVTSTVLQSTKAGDLIDTTTNNSSISYTVTTMPGVTITSTEEIIVPQRSCGMYNCENDATEYNSTVNKAGQTSESDDGSQTVLTLVFLGFAAAQVISSLIILFGVSDLPKTKLGNDDEEVEPLAKDRDQTENGVQNGVGDCHEMKNLSRGKNGEDKIPTSTKSKTTWGRIAEKALATGKFMIFSLSGKMLIPITIHIGMFQSFAMGQFTRHWVTCAMGLEYIGYSMSVLGVGAIIGSYGSGLLAQHVGRKITLGVTFLVELAVGIFLFVWDPNENDDVWIFMLIIAILGVLHATTKTVPPTLYSIFFPEEKEAANSAGCIWDALGSALAYAVSARICNTTFTIILLSLSGVGTLLYFGAEQIYQKTLKENADTVNKGVKEDAV